ncbi:MAG TPA: YraN family protein [Thermoanaerobaculia bacterium]|nr:YraN family protein [Thermoanaerobaculia bacterium]
MFERKLDPHRLGHLGERRAEWFYRVRGFRIVERNARLRRGEIDLIVRRGGLLVIAEVKTRQTLAAGEGFEAVGREKRERLFALGDAWLARSGEALQLRYDILSLFWNGRRFVVRHFPDAFRPTADAERPWKWRG